VEAGISFALHLEVEGETYNAAGVRVAWVSDWMIKSLEGIPGEDPSLSSSSFPLVRGRRVSSWRLSEDESLLTKIGKKASRSALHEHVERSPLVFVSAQESGEGRRKHERGEKKP